MGSGFLQGFAGSLSQLAGTLAANKAYERQHALTQAGRKEEREWQAMQQLEAERRRQALIDAEEQKRNKQITIENEIAQRAYNGQEINSELLNQGVNASPYLGIKRQLTKEEAAERKAQLQTQFGNQQYSQISGYKPTLSPELQEQYDKGELDISPYAQLYAQEQAQQQAQEYRKYIDSQRLGMQAAKITDSNKNKQNNPMSKYMLPYTQQTQTPKNKNTPTATQRELNKTLTDIDFTDTLAKT